MKKALFALSMLLVSSAPAMAWTCYSANNAGVAFYGVGYFEFQAARNALAACQVSTPYGYTCWLTTCSYF
jgi:hypothetical protein